MINTVLLCNKPTMATVHHVVILMALLLASGSAKADQTWDDPNCADVAWDFLPCLNFLQGLEPTPSWGCCTQLKDLNKIAKQKEDKIRICLCIADLAYDNGELISSRIAALPNDCGVLPSFRISNDFDCDET